MRNEEVSESRHRTRAVAKLRIELTKDIARATAVAGTCGLWELLRLCYLLHLTRVRMAVPSYRAKLTPANLAELQLRDEALKYAIGIVAKHGAWSDDTTAIRSLDAFNNDRVNELERYARHINAKFETEAILHIAKLRVMGDRDQDCFVDVESILSDPERSIYFYYGLRLDQSTCLEKDRVLAIPDLAKRFVEDFVDVEDLFEARCGISLEQFCRGVLELDAILRVRLQTVENILIETVGSINPDDKRTFASMSRALYFTDAELEDYLNSDFVSYLRNHPFDPAAASETELRFHYLTRRPFLMGRGFAVLSPELFFDSVLRNTHFMLLEDAESKAQYMAISASCFLDRVADVAMKSGYEEIEREVYLTQGKQDIGDIDLVLHNPVKDHTLLVEGKNHALPLPVYFKSVEAIDEHVGRSRDWETKVKRRIAHLHSASPSYRIECRWDYLVVSLMPEPLAHLSDLLVLSLNEFEQWLLQEPRDTSFVQFYENVYKPNEPNMSMEEITRLQEEGYFIGKVA